MNKKGITLIALVITIIVLLILAAVGINMAINSDGLFGKANEAAESWNTTVEEERTAISNFIEIAEDIGTVPVKGIELDNTSIYVPLGETKKLTATINPNNATYQNVIWSSKDEKIATVDDNGLITGVTEGETTITATTESKGKIAECKVKVMKIVSKYITEGTRKAPIPIGFVESGISGENKISEGLVIYQDEEPVTGSKYSTAHTNAMKSRNQYVWIPVDDINYMVMCKKNSSTSICDLELQEDGILKCETHNSTDFCGRLYPTSGMSSEIVNNNRIVTERLEVNESEWTNQTWDNPNVKEPAIIDDPNRDGHAYYLNQAGVNTLDELLKQLENDFEKMATSVAKYGGFYVSRYEVGVNGASKKGQEVLVAGIETTTGADSATYKSKEGGGSLHWYGMYKQLREGADINKTVVDTHMMWRESTQSNNKIFKNKI